MVKYNVRVLKRALREISGIYEYIRTDKEDAALKVYKEIKEAIAGLSDFPFRGSAVDKNDRSMNGYRFVMVKPYIIFYKISSRNVTVYHVIDGKRDYMKILE